jgi:hypothetical protein
MAKSPKLPMAPDRDRARTLLNQHWAAALQGATPDASPEIISLINSDQTAIRFCLVTQLLGKLTDHGLDALCLQKGDGGGGRWDPRGFATNVVVPWNRTLQSVLGASGDPYVSNPLRRPRVDHGLDQMGDPVAWKALCRALEKAQQASAPDVELLFGQTLSAVRDRLAALTFVYVLPARISLRQCERLVTDFLSQPSGGDRGMAVAGALFDTLRVKLAIWTEVRRGAVNAADVATGAAADLECVASDGKVVLAVEVKERRVANSDVAEAITKARGLAVTELLLCTLGFVKAEEGAINTAIDAAWASGTNVYHATLLDLVRANLPLLGEAGIREFVGAIGNQLDTYATQPKHRQAWKEVLETL